MGTAMFAEAGAAKVHAFDLSDDAVASAREACAEFPAVTVSQADGRELPLPDEHADVFISFETIEHINDDKSFLNEVVRVLKPNGVFICSTPNRTITMPARNLSDTPWNPYHVREYNEAEFRALLSSRFNSVDLLGQNPIPNWRVSLLSFLGRLLPGNLGGRINSATKIPRFAYDKEHHHAVQAMPPSGACEYLVAVCRGPTLD